MSVKLAAFHAGLLMPHPSSHGPHFLSISIGQYQMLEQSRHIQRSFSTSTASQHAEVTLLLAAHSYVFKGKVSSCFFFFLFYLLTSLWMKIFIWLNALLLLHLSLSAMTQEAGLPLNSNTLKCVSTHTCSQQLLHLIIIIPRKRKAWKLGDVCTHCFSLVPSFRHTQHSSPCHIPNQEIICEAI